MRGFRGNSEPPNSIDSDDSDYHDRNTGLRRSGFPIKISGIAMGSQESLNSGEESGPALWENALNKRRHFGQRRAAHGSSVANYGPFGCGLTSMNKSQRGLGCNYSSARTKRSSSITNITNALENGQMGEYSESRQNVSQGFESLEQKTSYETTTQSETVFHEGTMVEVGRRRSIQDLERPKECEMFPNPMTNDSANMKETQSTFLNEEIPDHFEVETMEQTYQATTSYNSRCEYEQSETYKHEYIGSCEDQTQFQYSSHLSNVETRPEEQELVQTSEVATDLTLEDNEQTPSMDQHNDHYPSGPTLPSPSFGSLETSGSTSREVDAKTLESARLKCMSQEQLSHNSRPVSMGPFSKYARESSVPPFGTGYHLQRPRGFSGFSTDQSNRDRVRRHSLKGRCQSEENIHTNSGFVSWVQEQQSRSSHHQHRDNPEVNEAKCPLELDQDGSDDEMVEISPGQVNIHEPLFATPQANEFHESPRRSREVQQERIQIAQEMVADEITESVMDQEDLTVTQDECLAFEDLFEKLVDEDEASLDLTEYETKLPSNAHNASVLSPRIYQTCASQSVTSELAQRLESRKSDQESAQSFFPSDIREYSRSSHVDVKHQSEFSTFQQQELAKSLSLEASHVFQSRSTHDGSHSNKDQTEKTSNGVRESKQDTHGQIRQQSEFSTFQQQELAKSLSREASHVFQSRSTNNTYQGQDVDAPQIVENPKQDTDTLGQIRGQSEFTTFQQQEELAKSFSQEVSRTYQSKSRPTQELHESVSESFTHTGADEPIPKEEVIRSFIQPEMRELNWKSRGHVRPQSELSTWKKQEWAETLSQEVSRGFQSKSGVTHQETHASILDHDLPVPKEEAKAEELSFSQLQDKFESSSSRMKEKRQRNLTIDYHDLAPNTWKWNGQVAKYVQKSYLSTGKETKGEEDPMEEKHRMVSQMDQSEEHVDSLEEGLGQGLGIILDKLRNIETKLDEIKTMEQNIWYPDVDQPYKESLWPEVGATPSATLTMDKSKRERSIMGSKDPEIDTISLCSNDHTLMEDQVSVKSEDLSQTLMANVNDSEDVLSLAETIPADDLADNIIITTPDSHRKSPVKEFIKHTVDITSLATSDDEDEENSTADAKRNARIEELAQKIMKEREGLKKLDTHDQPKAPLPPLKTTDDLDTVSEGSDEEDEDNRTTERRFRNIGITIRRRRTRSASRDRALAKIRYCWRCHQTGHENFDCKVELHPGNWCPRCLDKAHWEDGCWVNEQQIFCTICTLPGHLPCVHETSDFRQRKLIVETFGWLAFKDWFREPDFWSWWNISGYTNVPLYKLMQHNRTKEV
eukprot:maker-scaffold372_size192401-snap-gene-0.45 protein:Tk00575 transcript:maker-scaffold372_size192401-snap-gene-0.45-mRNA-1 annotation:"hypothetical protein SPRG_04597"